MININMGDTSSATFQQAPPFRLVLAPITPASLTWASTHYPQYLRDFGAQSRRDSYLLGRALLAETLMRYFGQRSLPEIILGKHRKPHFSASNLSFNLTHSDQLIALIVAKGDRLEDGVEKNRAPAVGIDLEIIRPRRNFSGLLKRTFTSQEIRWILAPMGEVSSKNAQDNWCEKREKTADRRGIPRGYQKQKQKQNQNHNHNRNEIRLNPKAMQRFFALWSGKEAYLKADGRGLSGLNSLEFSPETSEIRGDLKGGALYITTLLEQDFTQIWSNAYSPQEGLLPHSFALYLPNMAQNQHEKFQPPKPSTSEASTSKPSKLDKSSTLLKEGGEEKMKREILLPVSYFSAGMMQEERLPISTVFYDSSQ